MEIKLTPAQEKLVAALKANPGTDAQEHLRHIRNQAIATEMIEKLLKFGILKLNQENGFRELAPAYTSAAQATDDKGTAEERRDTIPNVEFGGTVTKETPKKEASESREFAQPKKNNKKALILEMLQNKARLDEMAAATGWEEKSVRGVMSQLKKEKHLNICHEKDENEQNFYYIAGA